METEESAKDQNDSTATLLFCRLCQAVYRQPKILPCLHSFCRPCLVNAVTHTASRGTVVSCPVCSHEARLPPNGIVGIPDNCFLNRLCQEYVSEVQSHLVARSLHAGQPTLPSESTSLRTRLSDVTAHTKTLTPVRSVASRPTSVSSSIDDPTEPLASGDRTAASAVVLEAIGNMSRIQTKIMTLQGQALRVTYAIDSVNQSMVEWHQHREDLRRAVQRRAAQFQFFIKRLEHQLISQIDSKVTDDNFYADSDRSKMELRRNLRNILHEVSVLKGVQERGSDAEINAMSASILGQSVGMSEVSLKKVRYELTTPTKTLEEMLIESFGSLSFVEEKSSVFNPEATDFTDLEVGATPATMDASRVNFEERLESFTEEEVEEEFRRSKRKTNEKKSRRHNTDLGLNSPDVKEYLAQFQNARESFRNRRREILLQGQMAREDASPVRHEIRARPRSSSRDGRIQSLDRAALPVIRGRSERLGLLASRPENTDIASGQYVAVGRPADISLPSPVIEEAPVLSSPVRSLVKQISDPRYEPAYSPSDTSTPSLEIVDQLPGSGHSSRRHSSEQLIPLVLQPRRSLEILDNTSRPLRRALSAAGDRKSKMEFLRENWQRRKEILMQNEGFISPDGQQMTATTKPIIKSPPVTPVLKNINNRAEITSDSYKPKAPSALSPPTSPDDVKLGAMQQLRSRISHFREIIKGNGTGRDVVEKRPIVGNQQRELTDKSTDVTREITTSKVTSPVVSPVTSTSFSKFTAKSPVNNQIFSEIAVVTTIPATTTSAMATTAVKSNMVTAVAISTMATATLSTASASPHTLTAEIAVSSPPATPSATGSNVQVSSPAVTQPTGYVSRYGLRSTLSTASATTTTTTSSRYARSYTKSSDTFDAAAMIAAMYSGNEKSIISSKKVEENKDKAMTNSTATSVIINSAASSSSASTASEVGISTSITLSTSSSSIKAPSSSTLSTITSTSTTSSSTNTSTSTGSVYSGRLYSRYSSNRSYTQDPMVNGSTTGEPLTTTSNTAELTNTATGSVQLSSPLSLQPSMPSSQSSVTVASITAPLSSSGHEPPLSTQDSTSSESSAVFSFTDSSQNGTPPKTAETKFVSRRSRYTGQGFNRRHTIEVGKSDIQEAMALQAGQRLASPMSMQTSISALPPVAETDHTDDITSVTYTIGQRGLTGRYIPAPLNLEPLQEGEEHSPSRAPSSLSAAVAAIKSPSLSPTSPEASIMKGRLRDIARKKKERWRHLTIH